MKHEDRRRSRSLWPLAALALLLCSVEATGCASGGGQAAVQALDSFSRTHADVMRAAETGDWLRVRTFLDSNRGSVDPVVHFFAGNLLFHMGLPDEAYREHLASATGALTAQGRFEATIDLLAMRRFADACAVYAQVPRGFLGKSGQPTLDAYMQIRCGKPAEGLRRIQQIFREGHSQGEEDLASVFSEQHRFSFYRTVLTEASKTRPSALDSIRALGELLLCGDFSNPWQPKHHEGEAVDQFQKVHAEEPMGCVLEARAAMGEMLRAGYVRGGNPDPTDLVKARALLASALEKGPACEDAAVAHYAYLDMTSGEDLRPLIAILESTTKRFPASASLHRYLMDRYREAGLEKEHRTLLESMVAKFPDDPFAYTRLAILDAVDGKDPTSALTWLQRGLGRVPESLPLNYLLVIFQMKRGDFKAAVGPATRVLAGLLETKSYHHDWEPGMALLKSALDAKSLWPTDSAQSEGFLHQLASLGLSQQARLFRSNYGCFSSGGAAVAIPDDWFNPQVVETAVRESLTKRASQAP